MFTEEASRGFQEEFNNKYARFVISIPIHASIAYVDMPHHQGKPRVILIDQFLLDSVVYGVSIRAGTWASIMTFHVCICRLRGELMLMAWISSNSPQKISWYLYDEHKLKLSDQNDINWNLILTMKNDHNTVSTQDICYSFF